MGKETIESRKAKEEALLTCGRAEKSQMSTEEFEKPRRAQTFFLKILTYLEEEEERKDPEIVLESKYLGAHICQRCISENHQKCSESKS